MADSTIGGLQAVQVGDLPSLADIYDDTLIAVEIGGVAHHITGAQWKAYAVAAAQNVNKGADGLTPYIGENGNWWIGAEDTGVNGSGDDGETPYIGENGNWWIGEADTGVRAAGTDGETPHIGDNGHWFVGDTDTGVAAQGPAGDGSGDMTAAVYDPDGHATDIFKYCDDAVATAIGEAIGGSY